MPLSYSTKRPKRRYFLPSVVLAASVAVYFASICQFSRYYALDCVFECGEGFVRIYWGGPQRERNKSIFNGGGWPVGADASYAGMDWSEGFRWEHYGPSLALDPKELNDRIKNRGLLNALGFSFPRILSSGSAISIEMPCGLLPIMALGALVLRKIRGVGARL
jgi:hypothetical protein